MYTDKRCVPEGGLMSALAKLRRDSSKYLEVRRFKEASNALGR